MVYLVQRIIINSNSWTRPSPPRLGRGEGEYVRENGFGHEDWNFKLDLAILEHVYGHACYEPSPAKAADQFHIAFVTDNDHRWRLAGFYLDAEFIKNSAPTSATVLKGKLDDLMNLKSANSLGTPWARLDAARMTRKLKDEER